MREYTGREYNRRPGSGVGLVEHGEVAQTACPSHRYDNLWEIIGEDMTKEEVLDLIRELQDRGSLASTTDVLSCVAQIVGVEENSYSYSDKKRIEKVRNGIKSLATAPKGV